MATQPSGASPTRESIFSDMVGIVKNMTSDWDTAFDEPIGMDTRLIRDLGFESIDVVHLVVAIETQFKRRDLPFEQLLMADDRYVDELTLRQIVDFLAKHHAQ